MNSEKLCLRWYYILYQEVEKNGIFTVRPAVRVDPTPVPPYV